MTRRLLVVLLLATFDLLLVTLAVIRAGAQVPGPVVYQVSFTEDPASCPQIAHWEAMTTALPAADMSQLVIADTIWPGAIGGCVSGTMTDKVSLPPGPQRVFLRACSPPGSTPGSTQQCSALSNSVDVTGVVPTTTTTTPGASTTTTLQILIQAPSVLTITPVSP